MNRRDAGHGVLIVAVVIIAVVVIGLLGWVFWQNFNTSSGSSVKTFDECVAAPGSRVLETYPEQCIATNGQTFTGPTKAGDKVKSHEYCASVEKLCFNYRDDWKITAKAASLDQPEGATGDLVTVTSPDGDVVLTLETGIGGIGGTCPDEFATNVTVLEATPIEGMTGYKDEFSINTLQVARIAYQVMGEKFGTGVYVTDEAEYSTPGTIYRCGAGFSMFVDGKNARLGSDTEEAGAFRFGMSSSSEGPRYASLKDATDAFSSDTYKQAVTLLASLHYKQ